MASFRHPDEATWGPGRVTTVHLVLVPEARAATFEALGRLEALALADHPKQLRGWSRNDEGYLNAAFVAAGYEQTGSGVEQELDSGRRVAIGYWRCARSRGPGWRSRGIVLRHAAGRVPMEQLLDAGRRAVQRELGGAWPHAVDEPVADRAAVEDGDGVALVPPRPALDGVGW